MGGKFGGGRIHVCMAEALRCSPETLTTLLSVPRYKIKRLACSRQISFLSPSGGCLEGGGLLAVFKHRLQLVVTEAATGPGAGGLQLPVSATVYEWWRPV